MRKESTSLALSLLLLIGCPYVSIDDLDARMDLDGDGVPRPEDCDDDDPEVSEAMTWYADGDGDGWGGASTASACALPSGFSSVGGDCDDADPSVHPDAVELCNEQDDDCDGDVDEGQDLPTWYLDADQDGYGDDDSASQACTAPDGWIAQGEDCDDSDAAVNPGAEELCNGIDDDCDTVVDDGLEIPTWYADADHDGYGDPTALQQACDMPSGHVAVAEDCDDADDEVHPGASETCNERDDDCDDEVDEGLEIPTWYRDADEDGYGDPEFESEVCSAPSGYVATGGDCDDLDPLTNPGELERCDDDDLDEDCDGLADDADSGVLGTVTVYQDSDGDGYGVDDVTAEACDAGSGWALAGGDCDDADADRHPEIWWYRDVDEDGYGNPLFGVRSCLDVEGYVTNGLDCADSDPTLSPDADEVCDDLDIDEDCDGLVDDADPSVVDQLAIYEDIDGDGYGDDLTETLACDLWSGWVLARGDCETMDPAYSPGEPEDCDDGIDQDCDGDIDCDDVSCSYDEACGFFVVSTHDGRWVGDNGDLVGSYIGGLAWAGDVSGDGQDEILVGVPWADGYRGAAYLIDGASHSSGDLASSATAIIEGDWNDMGADVAAAGDVDADGYADILIGVAESDVVVTSNGELHLFHGPLTGTMAVGDSDVVLLGDVLTPYGSGAGWGWALDGGIDVTGNGVPDFIVGGDNSFGAYVVDPSGLSGEHSLATEGIGFTSTGWQWLGWDVELCEDVDGDGVGEALVTSRQGDPSPYLVTGPITSGGDIDSILTAGFGRPSSSHHFPSSLSCRGDVDGDGLADVLLGAYDDDAFDSNAGVSYLHQGPFSGYIGASAASAQLHGEYTDDGSGYVASLDADFDQDGFADIVVGAYGSDHNGLSSGTIYVFYGPVSGTVSVADAAVFLAGEASGHGLGETMSAKGDIDDDGVSDLLIGASGYSLPSESLNGAVYLMLGSRF
jgi:hypothetical protein